MDSSTIRLLWAGMLVGLMLAGCGEDASEPSGRNTVGTESPQPDTETKSNVRIAFPALDISQITRSTDGELKGMVVINDDDRIPLTFEGEEAVAEFDLPAGQQYDIRVMFEFFDDGRATTWMLAESQAQTIDIAVGENPPLLFEAVNYNYAFNDDDDCVNNLTELVKGTDPGTSDVPAGSVCAVSAPSVDYGIKTFRFSWPEVAWASHYRLFENADGESGYSQIGSDIQTTAYDHVLTVPLWERLNASYFLQACDVTGCSEDAGPVFVSANLAEAIGYFKASNAESSDFFGRAVALSADGSTLAVVAEGEDSAATGINGNQEDNNVRDAGAVYIFARNGDGWSQQAYVKASNTDERDKFGGGHFTKSVVLSADGNTLAVGAHGEDSADGEQGDNSAAGAGAVYAFARTGDTWSQQAYIKASNIGEGDEFGGSVALSADGNTLAVGANGEDSADGEQGDNSAADAGAVYIFIRADDTWSQQAYVKASNTGADDRFGNSVALSADGNTLAVGANGEDSAATGINGEQMDNSAANAGAVYVFTRTGDNWLQQAYIKTSTTEAGDGLGKSVALSADSNTLAVMGNKSQIYVFTHAGDTWSKQAYIECPDIHSCSSFAHSLALSGDGKTLAVGADQESSAAKGIHDNSGGGAVGPGTETGAGAAYVFTRVGDTWSQLAYIKASNTGAGDYFGDSLALSSDGNTLAVGAVGEGSKATGIDGDQMDESAEISGAVYLY